MAPNACLKLTPGNAGFSVQQASADEVARINMRTYGWADEVIFGISPSVVEGVRQSALERPVEVIKPRVPEWTGEVIFKTTSP